jgi:uncharacterized membrane protein YjgN (DUF898 family)
MKGLRFEASVMALFAMATVAFGVLMPLTPVWRMAFVCAAVTLLGASRLLWRAE